MWIGGGGLRAERVKGQDRTPGFSGATTPLGSDAIFGREIASLREHILSPKMGLTPWKRTGFKGANTRMKGELNHEPNRQLQSFTLAM